jgi:hypothetical protein
MGIEANKKYRQKYPNGGEADPDLQRAEGVVMSALSDAANSIPFIGSEVAEAAEEQRQEKLDKWRDYKKGINATITAAELGLSGASLLGAYANWKNWATAANATKRSIANLLQKAQLPMQVGGTLIDGYQTYDALQNNDNFNANYNGISAGLGIAGSVGASDIFLNSRLHSPKIDRVLDVLGIIQNSGDFIKFGYDSIFGNKKAEGGSIHIDPSKKGTFTAAASKHGMGVQEFASRVLAHPENYSPAMRKKANFARNAKKFKHSFGGPLVENLFVDGGGENPMDYDYKGTIYSDELKKQGITHVVGLPEIVVTGDVEEPHVAIYSTSILEPYIAVGPACGCGVAYRDLGDGRIYSA